MTLDKTKKVLMPEYLDKFDCIGPRCEDTCCRGWTVALDKKTYKKYKKSSNKKLKQLFDESVVRNRNTPTEFNYGTIKMDKGICPFLNDKHLCKIYIELGESYLSNTCYFYPRDTKMVNDVVEMSASASCPEITRLALLNPEPMGFVEIDENIKRPFTLNYYLEDTMSLDEKKDPLYHFWNLRIFMITLLQDRRYSLDERFLLLGLVLKSVSRLQKETLLQNIPMTLEDYQYQFEDVIHIKNLLNTSDNSIRVPFSRSFVEQISNADILMNFPNERYAQCVGEIISGLKILDKDMDLTYKIYKESYENYYEPYMMEKEYILENYFVNEVFKELYPFAKMKSIDESFIMLLTLYNILKFHIIGISSQYKMLDDGIVIKVIQSFSRVVLHHNDYLNIFEVQDGIK